MPETLQIVEVRCPNPKCKKKICESFGETNLKVKCPRCKTDFEVRS
jgi:phage FluMu protein Com